MKCVLFVRNNLFGLYSNSPQKTDKTLLSGLSVRPSKHLVPYVPESSSSNSVESTQQTSGKYLSYLYFLTHALYGCRIADVQTFTALITHVEFYENCAHQLNMLLFLNIKPLLSADAVR